MYVAITRDKGQHLSLRVKRPGDRHSLSRSATRALDVMAAFAEARSPLRAIEIARILAVPPSTANQLLKTMVESAHLLFNARTKTYMPSQRLVRFGSWITEVYGLGGKIHDLVQDVQRQTGMGVTVTTANDVFMQVIEVAGPLPQIAERGMHVSLFGTATGSAYLSTLDEGEIKRLADRARIPRSELPEILQTIELIRQSGYADGPSTPPEIWSIAMPLPEHCLFVPAVLGLAGPSEAIGARLAEFVTVMSRAITYWLAAPEAKS